MMDYENIGWSGLFLNDATKEEMVYKTKEKIKELSEEDAKCLLFWSIEKLKFLTKKADEYDEIKEALKVLKGV